MNKLTLSDCTILFFVYNHVETVQSSVESVVRIKAKYPGIQLFVFDDCSTDGSKEILDLFSGHYDFYCVNPRNLGFNLTFRNAILKLKTRLFFVGSHDEIYDEDIVFFTLKIFQQNDRIGFAFTDTWTINDDLPNNFKRPLYSHVYGNEFIFNKLTNNFNFSSMAKVNVLFNMEAVNTVGGVWE